MSFFQSLFHYYISPIRSFSRAARFFLWMTIIEGIILSGWQLFFNLYMLQSGFGRDFLGIVNSLPSLSALLFGIPIGRLSDRIGRKPSLILGLTLYSLALLGQITFRQQTPIMLMASLGGMFNMLFLVSQAPLMVKLSDTNNRTMLFSLNYGLQTLSGAVGSLFAGQLPGIFGAMLNVPSTSATAYQAVLLVSLLLGATALIPLWMMDEPQAAPLPTGQQAGTRETGFRSSLTRLTVKLSTPNFLIGFGAAILIPYMNVFFKDRFNISDSLLGFLFAMSSLLIGIGSIIGPRLSVVLGGKIRAVTFTQFTSLVFLMIAGFTSHLWLASIGFLVRAALMNMSSPLYSAFCMEQVSEKDQGLVNSVLNSSWQVGWAVGPYISGLVQMQYGFTPLFIATGILYFSAIMIMWSFFHKTERQLHTVPA